MYVKRLFCVVLLVSLVCVIPFQVNASPVDTDEAKLLENYNLEKSIRNAEKGIVDSNISDEILKCITVSGGENVTYTVECLGKASRNSRSEESGTMYALTATEKIESKEINENGVYTWLTLIWIDHFGTNNELVEVSGGWTPNGHTLSNKTVTYGCSNLCAKYPTTDSFTYSNIGIFGLTLTASSSVVADGNTQDPITVSISSSIFS